MKKLIILFFGLIAIQSTIKAGDDKPINFAQLPEQSQLFIKKHFDEKSIALVKMESDFFEKSYEVIFTNGNKVDFDKKGLWKEVDCKYTELPVDIIPVQIKDYVSKNYPNIKISKIEKERGNRYEVELVNGLDLTFDSKFNLIDIDN
ncbi:hypothetical protein GGR21_002423 [Dysgonomonas hofstadii]|uniref:Putative beta-lactamase-inhibitor-like PepSY-like domain-containing protein n=1 Tax=Dysgonomonas hofstadii TaxID=637886 RepID=A0A840CKD1_9BACT|nr:PepSY-like domain-containing protein [Dysgonomonas hofstadii]MBB4036517.1 hypothetical protein [Dysgonomonas hofstadii]